MKKIIRFVGVFSVVYLVGLNSWANNLRFRTLNVNDGLPYSSVRAITQDKNGFIWFATELGLARYDGYTLKTYLPNENDSRAIAGSYILDLEVDKNGTLWVTSDQFGLSRYNVDTDDFTVFVHDPNNDNSLSANEITDVETESKNYLWVATSKGLDLLNTETNVATHFLNRPDDKNSFPNSNIRALLKISENHLYVGTGNGAYLFDRASLTFKLIPLSQNEQLNIRSIAQSENGLIWFGTRGDGLFVFNPDTSVSEEIDFKVDVKSALSLYVDSGDNIWVGTSQHGLFRISPSREIVSIRPDKSDANGLSDKTILSLFEDQSEQMWVGTYNSGVNLFSPKHLFFGSQGNNLNNFQCIPSNDYRAALSVGNESILLGTLSGLTKLNLTDKTCENYSFDSNNNSSLSNNEVRAIFRDSAGNFWIGASQGLDEFIIDKKNFVRYGEQMDNSSVRKIIERGKFLYIATNKGLYKIELNTKKVSPVLTENKDLFNIPTENINIDSEGNIWIGSKEGIYIIESELDYIKQVKINNEPLTLGIIWSYLIDHSGAHWFTIENKGLFKYHPYSNTLIPIGKQLNLLTKEGFTGLYEDSGKNIWLATLTHGLYKIDSISNTLTNYRSADGLHSELFNFSSFTQFPDGRLFFGGKSGFNIFHPEKIKMNTIPPIVSITQLKLFGKKITPHKNYDGFFINKHISELNEIELSHRETVFGFDFVANHHLAPRKIRYFYQLEGFDKDWIETSAQNRGVTYNNISSGNYIFKLKAKTHNNIWSEESVILKIKILPAPWLTWWAFTIYGIIFVTLILLVIKNRTKILESRARELRARVTLKTKELVEEKTKVEQLLSRRNEEFANVSHEFRTPLTLILGPLAQVINKIKTEQELHRLNIVQKNGYRLLRMVDQLLNLETFRIKSITQKSPQTIGKSVKLITDAFVDLASEKQIKLSLTKYLDINFEFTPDAFEKILLNLLSNAIKYSKSGDSIDVKIERTTENQLRLVVSDTGIGIPQDKLGSIFERYNRILDENSEQVTGAGIGLALVKELVQAHKGKISIQSKLGEGTTIVIILPIIGEVNANQINLHSNNEIVAMELMSLSNQASIQSEQSEKSQDTDGNKSTILVIEDNSDMRQYICNSITDEYQVLTAINGKQGVRLAIEEVPDLIISDIMMPEMDGYQATNAIRKNEITNHIPIILLTARGDRESRLKGWYEKADEYLVKPFDVEELIVRISNLLSIRNILQEKFHRAWLLTQPGDSTALQEQNIPPEERLKHEFLEQLDNVIVNIYNQPNTKMAEIAMRMFMSERQLFRKLKGILNMSTSHYLRDYRLVQASERLIEGQPASNVALDVGFESYTYFGKCFKAKYNSTPSEYASKTKKSE